MIRNLLNLKGL